MLWSQRRNSGAHGAENSIHISALAGVEPRTLPWHLAAADVATRLSRNSPYIYIYIYICIYIYNGGGYLSVGPTVFRGPGNFEPSRGIWVFTAELGHGIRLFAAEFDVFHSNNYIFTENDLKVAL